MIQDSPRMRRPPVINLLRVGFQRGRLRGQHVTGNFMTALRYDGG